MKVEKIRQLLSYYDNGLMTKSEVESLAFHDGLRETIENINEKSLLISFIGGTFRGPLPHTYMMIDYNSQTQAYYKFTLFNVARFYWNKLMRKFNFHYYTKVW